ncbi:MAG: hypothetical protein KDC47_01375 [Flavobacteriaceae bacterium]|nr:hypothetical protein [Flavobacteriaceae bacterium]
MKKLIYLLIISVLYSCSGVKKTQESLNTGNYINAINSSISKLSENKTKKGNQEYIYILQDAFTKNAKRELENIKFLVKDNNPANYEKIFNAYNSLQDIQNRIEPLLPLYLMKEGKDATFQFKDYSDDIVKTKTKLSDYLYVNASNLLSSAINKNDYRKAYDDLMYLNQINPNYKDTNTKIEEAYQKGVDYVEVQLLNDTEMVIPKKLEEDLLNFNTYGLNDLWTTYHANPQNNINYDYALQVKFDNILISPEQISEKEFVKEKQVKDGWKYVLDEKGNVKKDTLGNDIKVDNFKTVRCNFYRFTQRKDVQISGTVSYFDLKTNQQTNSYPLTSGYIFEHQYANYSGDKRALESDFLNLTTLKQIPFPSNEQMIYDAGEDLKNNIKNILVKYRLN